MTRIATLAAALLALGAGLVGQPASAGPSQQRPVNYRDLDLTTDAGVRTLLARIHKAAQAVCRDELTQRSDVEPGRSYRNCRRATIRAAVQAVGSERLSHLAFGRSSPGAQVAGR